MYNYIPRKDQTRAINSLWKYNKVISSLSSLSCDTIELIYFFSVCHLLGSARYNISLDVEKYLVEPLKIRDCTYVWAIKKIFFSFFFLK